MVANPSDGLSRACEFLGVTCDPDYLEACCGIMFETPRRSRDKVVWTPRIIRGVEIELRRYDFFDGYCFSN